ncbi:MAG: cobyrinate a,c-diamide synthase [Chloroflexota bacterium]|nr:cobyrinate a,c-diamide synthase [Chloroflexota bacterium]
MTDGIKAVVIAGAASGVGKTTIAIGIIGALVRRGLNVQPFKTGPDYIDPSYHTLVAGRPSRNLDTWLVPRDGIVELFRRACDEADITIVEGVMGLYDGHSASDEAGSTAELAKMLGLPVVLVIDASGAARSVAAMTLGYVNFDPGLNLAGVIFNGIGSEGHFDMCRQAVSDATNISVLGYLPKMTDLTLPERHLGLVPTPEQPLSKDFLDRLFAQAEATLDIDGLLQIAGSAAPPTITASLFPERRYSPSVRIGIARDRAFNFYYQDNLDLLEAWGATLAPFSPTSDGVLPGGIDGVYIGGGFPEMYAAELARNTPMLDSIREAGENGMPVYAECGGLMYLGRSLRGFDGDVHGMAGLLPIDSIMDGANLTLGYRTVRALADSPLLERGDEVRGHEFHWSSLDGGPEGEAAYMILDQERREGFIAGNVLASYVHVHFASRPGMAQRFIEYCKKRGDRC